MMNGYTLRRPAAIAIAFALILGELPLTGVKVCAAQPDIIFSGREPEIIEDLSEDNSPELAGNKKEDTIIWQTGVAVIGELIPGGKALAPALNALGAAYGLGNSGITNEELIKKLKDMSKEISSLSKDISSFRNEMNERLDKFEREMSDEIETALNRIKNDIFTDGVGSELDTIHEQINGRNGIARKIEVINSDDTMSEEEKNIEIAYLIGNDKGWNNTGNVIYRFRLIGNLLAGQTYRDTAGRNLYQVLYDDAAKEAMMSGEAYNRIKPYIDRVMAEYFYSYSALLECLNASLYVSMMTDEQVSRIRETDDVEYERYLKCYVPADLVEQQLDSIDAQLLDAGNPNSIISLYSVFCHKIKNKSTVYIDMGQAEIPLSSKLDRVENPWTGKRSHNNVMNEGYYTEYVSGWHTKECYSDYYSKVSDLVGSDEHLTPGQIKKIYDHINETSPDVSMLQYLNEAGFMTDEFDNYSSCFALSGLSSETNTSANIHSCRYGFDTVHATVAGDGVCFEAPCELTMEYTGISEAGGGPGNGSPAWFVYSTLNDLSYLGLRITDDNEEMPETAEQVMELFHTDYTAVIEDITDDFELYQKYGPDDIPVSFYDAEGSKITEESLGTDQNGKHYRICTDASPLVRTDGSFIMFMAPGTADIHVEAVDPSGRVFTSQSVQINCRDIHESSYLKAMQTADCSQPLNVYINTDTSYDLNELIGPSFIKSGDGTAGDILPMWEAGETPGDGIVLDKNGRVTFSKRGIYHIRFKGIDDTGDYAYGEWNIVVARDRDEYYTMTFHDGDGAEIYRVTGKEGSAINLDEDAISLVRPGYAFDGWDRKNSEDDEIPSLMPGEHTGFYSRWTRTVPDGYTVIADAESFVKALSLAPESETTHLALTNDITVKKPYLPKAKDAVIVIDGLEHTLTFTGDAAITLRASQSLTIRDISIKSDKKGRTGNVSITAAAGPLTLDNVSFECKQAIIKAAKGDLAVNNTEDASLIVKGGSKQKVTVNGTCEFRELTGFDKALVTGSLAVNKKFKAGELNLADNGLFNVPTGSAVTISRGITGTGTIYLAPDFKPINLGRQNSGCIMLASYDALDRQVIFKSKAENLNSIFRVEDISPYVTDGNYEFGLYSKGSNVYLRAFKIRSEGKSYCEWNDCVADLSKAKGAKEGTIDILGDLELDSALKFPAKGRIKTLTINGYGHRISFKGKTVTLTCDLVLNKIKIISASGDWSYKKGRYTLTDE